MNRIGAPRRLRDGEELAFARAVSRGFHEDSSDEELAYWVDPLRDESDYRAWVVADGDAIVGNLGVFATDLTLPGGAAVPVTAVTAVGVAQTHRRRGLLRQLMAACLDEAEELGEPVAALYASEQAIYPRFGFGISAPGVAFRLDRAHARFRDPVDVRLVEGIEAHDAVAAFRPILEAARQRRAGLGRTAMQWTTDVEVDPPHERHGATARRLVTVPGRGYASYRIRPEFDGELPAGVVEVQDLVAVDPEAEAALWQHVCDIDLTDRIDAKLRPADDPLPMSLADPMRARATPSMPLYTRVLDVPRLLAARRYPAAGQLVLRVHDATRGAGGTWRLETDRDGVGACRRTDAEPDVELTVESLSSVWLGGVRAVQLLDARRLVDRRPGAAAALDRLLAVDRAPWTSFMF